MAPNHPRAAATVEAGALLDGRYRLDEHCRTDGDKQLWRGTDLVLDRTIAIHLIAGRTRTDAKRLTTAAGRAGSVSDARWVRILDVGFTPVGRQVTLWVVCEWVYGQTLTALVGREPLRDQVATYLVAACAHAVAAAERADAGHGALHPDEVIVAADGNPRLTGLETHRELGGDRDEYADVRGLGALLFAAVTGRWPLPGWRGLPGTNRGDGMHPRQQRRSVSRALDEVTARALEGGYSDAAAVARALDALPQTPLVAVVDDADSPRRDQWRRVAWWVVPPLLVTGVGFASWAAGSDLGRVPGEDRTVVPTLTQPHGRGPGTRLVWTTPPTVTSFDPQGNGVEDPGGVGLTVDDDPSTSWSTDVYHGNAHFGSLKDGVGLLVDLGRPKDVDTVRLLMSDPGADLEIRAGDDRPTAADDLPVVASRDGSPAALTLRLTKAATARYWLIWITSLPQTSTGDFSLGISEVALLR
ncbi:MAG TPA: hypothetical protein VG899_16080 [Mycobacteriales bacterium]|nr:hypothetical protein [Mycobacteriales bacterium]